MNKGIIHQIETLGTLDGPGIRYVIFLKGCPLRCKYCHNPDSWDMSTGYEMSVDEIITEAKKYERYFKFSGGGITISGGDPLMQQEFLEELLKAAKKEGIHTTIDTSGACNINRMTNFLDYTDLVLLDIKHFDTKKHFILTGSGNENTLAFLDELVRRNIPVWIRYVLVPGWTDDLDSIKKLSKYLSEVNKSKIIQRIEILPYHSMGIEKWETLNIEYELKDTPSPSENMLEEVRTIFKEFNDILVI